MPWSIATQPELDSGALEALKTQVREYSGAFDDELRRILAESVDILQEVTHRQLVTATAILTEDRFSGFRLPPSPLQSVTSITYIDTDGVEKTWDASNYEVVTTTHPGCIRLAQDGEFPSDVQSPRGNVTVTYEVGFGATWSALPGRFQRALLLYGHHTYRPDDPAVTGEMVQEAFSRCLVGDEFNGT